MRTLTATALLACSFGISAMAGPDFAMHEWGTFTSVHGSDGAMLPGLEREEEGLPMFVYSHDGMKISENGFARGKGLRRPVRGVTVKMETPVIYFYSEEGFEGSVEIGFAGGSISQWFPNRQGGETMAPLPRARMVDGERVAPPKEAGLIDFSDGRYEGRIKWDFEVLAPDPALEGKVFRPGETLTWLRPRQPASNVIKVGGEYEKYLFYRGLGNFEMPVRFEVGPSETLRIRNAGREAVPYALVFEINEHYQVGVHELRDGLPAGEAVEVTRAMLFDPERGGAPPLGWQEVGPHYEMMVAGLMGVGLRRDEADAMVQTWWHSYFQRPGLRVFWVVPPGETERVLPMTLTPAPRERVRVLVGRSEVLRPEFERELVEEFRADEEGDKWAARKQDRFGVAYETRVKRLLEAPRVTKVDP